MFPLVISLAILLTSRPEQTSICVTQAGAGWAPMVTRTAIALSPLGRGILRSLADPRHRVPKETL